jgi:hypothetical protein
MVFLTATPHSGDADAFVRFLGLIDPSFGKLNEGAKARGGCYVRVRWPETEGKPVCPHCGGLDAYECRRPPIGTLRFRCKACRGDFTIISGTLFAFHKLPLRGFSRPLRSSAMRRKERARWPCRAIYASHTKRVRVAAQAAKRWRKN